MVFILSRLGVINATGKGDEMVWLDRYPVFSTKSVEEAERGLRESYGVSHFESSGTSGEFEAIANKIVLPRLRLSYCDYTCSVQIHFPEAASVRQQFVISGSGTAGSSGRSYPIDPERSFVIAADAAVKFDYSANFQQLVLSISADALDRQLGHLIGVPPKLALTFEGAADFRRPEQQRMQRLVRYIAGELNEATKLPEPFCDELEDAVITAFLLSNRNNFSDMLNRDEAAIAPWQVRFVEEYIDANWQQAITIEILAHQCGVGARSIFKRFKEARGYSPMAYLKNVRLRRARDRLSVPDQATSVTAVAFACGFHNLGHFSKDYAQTFGELPSETIKRSRLIRIR